jgi:hypothetical protein
MKTIKYIFYILLTAFVASCSDDNNENEPDELAGLLKVQEFTNDTHVVEAYTESGKFIQGYNDITLRIKDKTAGKYVDNAQVSWMPVMHMLSMSHSCPKSAVIKVAEAKTTYKGYIVFQMPENDMEGWDLTLDYSIGGVNYTVNDEISVPASGRQVVTAFTGTDGKRYIVALIEPSDPKVSVNDMRVGVYTMENLMSFPVVKNFSLDLDPRMPGMGNHSSPNNQNLVFNSAENVYDGKLSLTMTGYWKLNLILRNEGGTVIKGEPVTVTNESSTLYLEIEF